MQNYKGIIIFNNKFPIGGAGTNRMMSIAKGLSELGLSIHICVIRPTEDPDNIINKNRSGNVENFSFGYISRSTVKSKMKAVNAFLYLSYRLLFLFYLFKNRRSFDFIIIPDEIFSLLVFINVILVGTDVKIIRHVDEYPSYILEPNRLTFLYKILYEKYFYHLVDAVIVMTKKLETFYKKISPQKILFLHVPMSVDLNRFENIEIDKNDNYITYCGDFGFNNKDGVSDLIIAFAKISSKYPKIKLKIIGGSRNRLDKENLIYLTRSLNIEEKVLFTGRLPSYQIPYHLSNSKILALARPDNKQAEGGFPTKLGEYLATGKPVVVTAVGEIPDYLVDGINAFISQPNNPENFASKIQEALSDYNRALKIGAQGKVAAMKYFNYKNQSEIIAKKLIGKLVKK
jgi:glycosyltransferase involved in cell wall biosynthesis